MKIIICGGREFRLFTEHTLILTRLHQLFRFTEIVSGRCAGADKDAEDWAKENHLPIKQFIPAWVAEGKKAGPLRNEEMANYADACIAFPGGKGTADMIDRALAHGLLTIVMKNK